jgi:hypothetical protein
MIPFSIVFIVAWNQLCKTHANEGFPRNTAVSRFQGHWTEKYVQNAKPFLHLIANRNFPPAFYDIQAGAGIPPMFTFP